MESAYQMSFCPKGSNVRFIASLLKDGNHDWLDEGCHAMGATNIAL